MVKRTLPATLIVVCSILIVIDLLLHSGEMGIGLWLRILTNLLVIMAMAYTLRDQARSGKKQG